MRTIIFKKGNHPRGKLKYFDDGFILEFKFGKGHPELDLILDTLIYYFQDIGYTAVPLLEKGCLRRKGA